MNLYICTLFIDFLKNKNILYKILKKTFIYVYRTLYNILIYIKIITLSSINLFK